MKGKEKKQTMDIDTLQTLCVYIVYQMNYPQFIADYYIVKDLVSYNV